MVKADLLTKRAWSLKEFGRMEKERARVRLLGQNKFISGIGIMISLFIKLHDFLCFIFQSENHIPVI
jgi:hypothetical protein